MQNELEWVGILVLSVGMFACVIGWFITERRLDKEAD